MGPLKNGLGEVIVDDEVAANLLMITLVGCLRWKIVVLFQMSLLFLIVIFWEKVYLKLKLLLIWSKRN